MYWKPLQISLYFRLGDLLLMLGEIKITFAGERNFTLLEPLVRFTLEAFLILLGGFNIVFNAVNFSAVSNWSTLSNKSPDGKPRPACRLDEFSTLDRLV